jgi:phage shock protein E
VSSKLPQREAKKLLDSDSTIKLLDVRDASEYALTHIPGSILIPLSRLEEEVEDKFPDKNTKIFVYCKSGGRSAMALRVLEALGYRNAYNIGGIDSWPYERTQGSM